MKYIGLEQIFCLHEEAIKNYGGSRGIRDQNLLDSAIVRPRMSVFGKDAYPSLFLKAAVLLHSLVKNHPFVDDNKRAGFAAMHLMLLLNKYDLTSTDRNNIDFVLKVAKGNLPVNEIAAWIEKHSKKKKGL